MHEVNESAKPLNKCESAMGSSMLMLKRILCLSIVIFLVMGFAPRILNAHPPKRVTLSYDMNKKILKVIILHPSFMPSVHYIKTVTLQKNKQNPMSHSYNIQTGDEFTYTYDISAVSGDTLVVTATCSMYGSMTETLRVP